MSTMDLPHLTLFIRRMWRTPGRTAMLFLLFWLGLVLLVQYNPDLQFGSWQAADRDRINILMAVMLLGHFALFYVIATGMRAVVDDVRGGIWGWHVAPVGNAHVLAGALLSTAGISIIPLAGLMAFAPLAAMCAGDSHMVTNGQLGLDMFSFAIFALFFALRLAHFALMAACFQLAFRRTALATYVPALLAAAASIGCFWQGRLVYENRLVEYTNASFWWLLGVGGLLVIAGLLLLSMLTDTWRLAHVLLMIVVLILPAAMGLVGLIADLSQPRYTWNPSPAFSTATAIAYGKAAILPHSVLANAYPNLEIAWEGNITMYRMSAYQRRLFYGARRAIFIYNQPQTEAGTFWLIVGYLVSGVVWWFTALISLDMVRRPQKYLSWQPWRR
jgi:hypothetical protein